MLSIRDTWATQKRYEGRKQRPFSRLWETVSKIYALASLTFFSPFLWRSEYFPCYYFGGYDKNAYFCNALNRLTTVIDIRKDWKLNEFECDSLIKRSLHAIFIFADFSVILDYYIVNQRIKWWQQGWQMTEKWGELENKRWKRDKKWQKTVKKSKKFGDLHFFS